MNSDTPQTDNDTTPHPRGLHHETLNWRHRAFILAYIKRGFDDPAQCAVDAGIASGTKAGERIARGYLALPAVQDAIRNALRTSGINEGVIRAVVQKWLWHEDPNASLRAADLGARILGMLREPAPAVPQLPPLIVVQALPSQPQAVTSGEALPADYSVVEPIKERDELIASGSPLIDVQQAGLQPDVPDRPPKPQRKARKAVTRTGTRKAKEKAAE